MSKGHVIWLTGLSGAGKTTLANLICKDFEIKNINNQLLDGDKIRNFFKDDMGFSEKDREDNLKRIAFASKLLADNGISVVVAAVSSIGRDFLRNNLENYIQIYVKATIEKVIERDTKGMYKKFADGKLKNIVGMDLPYHEPHSPDIIVHTDKETIKESHIKIIKGLTELNVL